MARALALDYGSARCGCALSDPTGTLATPIEVVERPGTRKGLGRILGLIRAHAADYGIDPARVGVMGFSAGGHVAARLATTPLPTSYYNMRRLMFIQCAQER